MLQRGFIRPACSEWAAPVILVKKKSLDGTPKYIFCIDFRGLNAATKIPVYPIRYKRQIITDGGKSLFYLVRCRICLLAYFYPT
jgi:hypothetical protein